MIAGGEVLTRNDDGAVFTATLPLTAEDRATSSDQSDQSDQSDRSDRSEEVSR